MKDNETEREHLAQAAEAWSALLDAWLELAEVAS